MKQTLNLKLSQQLTLTPQLKQSLKLLQLPSLDLELEIQQALDSNPLLEPIGKNHLNHIELIPIHQPRILTLILNLLSMRLNKRLCLNI